MKKILLKEFGPNLGANKIFFKENLIYEVYDYKNPNIPFQYIKDIDDRKWKITESEKDGPWFVFDILE